MTNGMITRSQATELQSRLDAICQRIYGEKYIVIGKKGISFSSLEQAEAYCTRNNIKLELIHRVR